MTDKTVYLCAETGTLSGTTVTLSGSVISGMLAAQLFADALSDGDTVTITVADASTPTTFAVYSGVPFTASGTTLDLSAGTLLDSNGTLGSSVNVLGFVTPVPYTGATANVHLGTHLLTAGNIYSNATNHCVAVGATVAAAWMAATSDPYYDVAIGEGALATTPTAAGAQYNIANGYQALYSNTTGHDNIANGYQALKNNTTGKYNTANGTTALQQNTSGSYNIANGATALQYNTTGNYNTANGYRALYSNDTGGSNIANGYQALYNNDSGDYNTANGTYALRANTTGSNNIANGAYALYANTTADNNVANGYTALRYNTTGHDNIANGAGALFNITDGSYNVANGTEALYKNTSAASSVAEGYRAAYGPSTYANQGGVYIGYKSGYSADDGSDYNTLLGYQAGYSLTIGAYNIGIGQNIDLPSATGDQQLNIGNLIYGSGIYNGSSVSSTPVSGGKVGIMIAAPTAALDINSDTIRLRSSKTPASASDTGDAGEIAWDSGYVYVCVATDTWKRAALSTW